MVLQLVSAELTSFTGSTCSAISRIFVLESSSFDYYGKYLLLFSWHYRVWSSNAASTTTFPWPRYLAEPWQHLTSRNVASRRTLSIDRTLGLPWGCLPIAHPYRALQIPLSSGARATCPAHCSLLDLNHTCDQGLTHEVSDIAVAAGWPRLRLGP